MIVLVCLEMHLPPVINPKKVIDKEEKRVNKKESLDLLIC
jgi:hypothetical protein